MTHLWSVSFILLYKNWNERHVSETISSSDVKKLIEKCIVNANVSRYWKTPFYWTTFSSGFLFHFMFSAQVQLLNTRRLHHLLLKTSSKFRLDVDFVKSFLVWWTAKVHSSCLPHKNRFPFQSHLSADSICLELMNQGWNFWGLSKKIRVLGMKLWDGK